MLCQTCGAFNDDEREYCFRCQNKLLVLSGVSPFEEDEVEEYGEDDGDLSLDEHLLERVSAIEEIVKRSAETARQQDRGGGSGRTPGVRGQRAAREEERCLG